ncbi:MAG TPA: VOC family protein [Candidatus Binatia bacterium]|jgi:catechol 2,3-dioxygenase-like lactoylglutathione lyase family enzyme|nr:VOC family protein [Candidatus Binatia bacterium]
MGFKINHLHIKTSDPSKTAEWFVENLGARIARENRDGQQESFRLDLHGLSLNVTGFLSEQKLEQHYGMEHLALDTDDIVGTVQRLKERGIRILEERRLPDGRQVCFFEGPEGVRLEVMEWK